MEITFSKFILTNSSFFVALAFTLLFCFLAFRFLFPIFTKSSTDNKTTTTCDCFCSLCNNKIKEEEEEEEESSVPYYSNGGGGREEEMRERGGLGSVMTEKQTGASMMEQLVPEITTHALSYLDYPSLCRLSMTNSLMRKAANDDNAWKALYHKDFTLEQNSVTPINGWKAYYATTRAIVNINADFFNIIRERLLPEMNQLWLNADYVKCIHASGEIFSGYNAVIQSWQLAFEWQQAVDFQIRDVRARVLTDTAWVTMKAYVDMETGPFNVTNVFEFHNGQWYMVHHHSSVMLIVGGVEQQMVHG